MIQALGGVEGILEHTLFKGELPMSLKLWDVYCILELMLIRIFLALKFFYTTLSNFCSLIFEYMCMCLYPHSKETCAYRGGSGSNMMVGQGSRCGINNFNNLQ